MYLDYKLLTSYFLMDDTVLHVANGIVIILLYVVYPCRLIEYYITYCFHEPNARSEINRKIRKSNISYYSYSIFIVICIPYFLEILPQVSGSIELLACGIYAHYRNRCRLHVRHSTCIDTTLKLLLHAMKSALKLNLSTARF